MNKETNAVFRAGFLKMRYVIFLFKPFNNSLFNYGLAIGYAEKRRINAPAVYGESVCLTYIVFPRQRLNAVKKAL